MRISSALWALGFALVGMFISAPPFLQPRLLALPGFAAICFILATTHRVIEIDSEVKAGGI